jgi:Zn finger protein HypA/HybF involved in hydrogenase expression
MKTNIKCTNCQKVSTNKEWNLKTLLYIKQNDVKEKLTPIQNTLDSEDTFYYVCPSCKQPTSNQDVELVTE